MHADITPKISGSDNLTHPRFHGAICYGKIADTNLNFLVDSCNIILIFLVIS